MTMPQSPDSAVLRLPYASAFLPAALAFVSHSAQGFAFGRTEANALVLATEELFTYYLGQTAAGAAIQLRLENFDYQLLLTLEIPLANPDLQALNLTHRVNQDSEASLATLGPMIAARCVSRFNLAFAANGTLQLQLVRVRDYPLVQAVAPAARVAPTEPLLQAARSEDLLHLAALVAHSGADFVPAFLMRPGMAAAMLARGDLAAIVAQDGGVMTGAALWKRLSDSTIEMFGPYLFYPDTDGQQMAALLDAVVSSVSRSGARLLVRRQDRLVDYARYFDFLGEVPLRLDDPPSAPRPWPHYFRQLREDVGGRAVYADAQLAAFLRREYARLCLPRQVRELPPGGVARAGASVLRVEFEQERSLATLRPLCAGRDVQEMHDNFAAHLALLQQDGIRNLLVEIDTGRSDDTAFAAVLPGLGFTPQVLVPDAGQGDLVLYAPTAKG